MLGGVESLLLAQVAASQRDATLRPEFALCFQGAFSQRVEALGAPVRLLGEPRLRSPLRTWRARRALGALLRERTVDAAIVHSGWSHALFAPVLAAARVPWARWHHAPLDTSLWLERAALRHRPALVICNSGYTRQQTEPAYAEIPCRIVYCPVDLPVADAASRDAIRRELATESGDLVITIVGRFEPLKGHDTLLRALAQLAAGMCWTCWMVGEPQSRGERRWHAAMQALAHELGVLSRVRFVGQRTDVHALLAASDIYCQPNRAPEGFGMALAEALASSLPIVTTGIGAAREIVSDACGVLVPPDDPHAVADALEHLASHPALRLEIGARGAERAAAIGDAAAHVRATAAALAPMARRRPETLA
jgi:glycosyltransferase involved in cell wall biosynthesis